MQSWLLKGGLPECSLSDSSPGSSDPPTLEVDITSWVKERAEVLHPDPESLFPGPDLVYLFRLIASRVFCTLTDWKQANCTAIVLPTFLGWV